jgi:hypothetical protein
MRPKNAASIAILLGACLSAPALAGGPFQVTSIVPCRVFDTRTVGPQTNGQPLTNPGPHFFRIQGYCGVPDGAQAVTLNLTIVAPSQAGDMRLYPANISPGLNDPSTINYPGGIVLANGALLALAPVTLSTDNDIQIVIGMQAPGTVHAIIDVTGYVQ